MAQVTFYSRLKGFAMGTALAVVICISAVIYLQNREGFTGRWNIYVEEILAEFGFRAEVGSFRYSIIDGIVIRNFTLLAEDDSEKVCATFEKVILDFDNKMVARGKFDADRLSLKGGQAWVDLHDKEENRIFIDKIDCDIDLTRGYDVIIENCSAVVNGIPLTLTGRCLGVMQPKGSKSKVALPQVLREIFKHVYQVEFPESQTPHIYVDLTHTYGAQNGLDIDIKLKSDAVRYKGLDFTKLTADLRYVNQTLQINSLLAEDDTGNLSLTGKYYVGSRKAEFDLTSTTNLPKILRSFSIESFADKLVSPLPPKLTAKGTILGTKKEDEIVWGMNAHGHITLDEFRLLGTTFASLDTDFSWKDRMLYLRDMNVVHEEGLLTGRILIMNQYIRYEAESNLPVSLYKPFVKDEGILANNIKKTRFGDDSSILLKMKGSMQRDQIDQWEASGQVALSNIAYNEVPLKAAQCNFVFTPLEARFQDISATFDYSSYLPSKYAEKQPSSGTVTVGKVAYDSEKKNVTIDGLQGTVWPAPIINLFAPKVGNFIDDTVYCTAPPTFSTSGVIGIGKNSGKTALYNKIQRPVDLYYTLLGKVVRFDQMKAQVQLIGRSVFLKEVTSHALKGKISGDLEVKLAHQNAPRGGYEGDIAFTQIGLKQLAERYEFENKTNGHLTGRLAFKGLPNDISSLNGDGFIGLDRADLFYIPIFGPLSPILRGVLGHRKTSHEKVNSVSADFIIKNGRAYTNSLQSITNSTKIKGDGYIDIKTKEIDLTVRTSTKGLLGLITLPIKPLEKLLQFRGTGTISEPSWVNSPFEATPKYLEDTNEVNRAIIVE